MLKAWLAVRNCLQAYWGRARSFFFALLPTIYLLSHKFRLYSSNYEDRITTTILQLFAICYISNNQRTAKLLHSFFLRVFILRVLLELQFFEYVAIHVEHLDMAILINSKSWQIASLWECWRTCIAYHCTFSINIEVPKVGVTVEEHIGMA